MILRTGRPRHRRAGTLHGRALTVARLIAICRGLSRLSRSVAIVDRWLRALFDAVGNCVGLCRAVMSKARWLTPRATGQEKTGAGM